MRRILSDFICRESIQYRYMRSYQHNIFSRPVTSIPTLLQQFQSIDSQNKELIKLTDTIQNSSFMANHTFPHHIIQRIQEDLRRNLAGLISNIHQIIDDIDKRLRALSQFFEQTSNQQKNISFQSSSSQLYIKDIPQPSRPSTVYLANHTAVDPYQSLLQRISSLEINLKNSQQNEAKLISILEKLQKRNQQQPILPPEVTNQVQSKVYRGFPRQSIQKSRLNSQADQRNFRLFALQRQNNSRKKQESQTEKAVPERTASRNPFTCVGQSQKDNLQPSRIEPKLGPMTYEKSEASTHSRRMSFMMNTLNS